MKRSFNNATTITRFNVPVDLCTIVDELEGGAFKVTNRRIDASGPPDVKSPEETLTRAQSAGSKLPKVADLKDDSKQVHKSAYKQIWLDCDRGNIEIIPQHGTTFCIKKWNGEEDRTRTRYMEPPVLERAHYISKDTDDYATVDGISRRPKKSVETSDWEGRRGRSHR